jgi:hypothetical protein
MFMDCLRCFRLLHHGLLDQPTTGVAQTEVIEFDPKEMVNAVATPYDALSCVRDFLF